MCSSGGGMGTLLSWQMGQEGELAENMGAPLGVEAREGQLVRLCLLGFVFGFGFGFGSGP
jgi:hypothetical protein